MVEVRKTLLAVAAVFVVAVSARAGLTPVSAAPVFSSDQADALPQAESHEILLFGVSDETPMAGDVGSQACCLPHETEVATDAEEGPDTPQTISLKDGRGSVDLCLYALIGLGVLRSGHWVKRPSLGFVPEWYHTGGPDQIGHSHAVGPDSICIPTICFIQPDVTAESIEPHYAQETITSLARQSQSRPTILAVRPPPTMS